MPRPTPQAESGELHVIHEDHDLVVVDKPAGLTVHPTAKRSTDTLANLLLDRFPALASVGEPHRPGIVHRLDRDVSGVMVIARTKEMYAYLKNLFAERDVHKEYAAVVLGVVKHDSGTIDAALGRTSTGRTAIMPTPRSGVPLRGKGVPAITHYEALRRGTRATLLKVTTETGRMHQIRVHLRHLGHPIVGDTLYGKRNAPVKSGRLLLHATKISFVDLHGKKVTFVSPLPDEFLAIP